MKKKYEMGEGTPLTLFELGFSVPPIWIGGGCNLHPIRKIGFLNEYLLNRIEILTEAVNIILVLIFCGISDIDVNSDAILTSIGRQLMTSIYRQMSDVNYFVWESIGNAHTFLKEGVRNSRNNEVSNFKFYTHLNKVYELKVPKYKVTNSCQS